VTVHGGFITEMKSATYYTLVAEDRSPEPAVRSLRIGL